MGRERFRPRLSTLARERGDHAVGRHLARAQRHLNSSTGERVYHPGRVANCDHAVSRESA
jgi:hypothetical protein